jgi:hypothetical protein
VEEPPAHLLQQPLETADEHRLRVVQVLRNAQHSLAHAQDGQRMRMFMACAWDDYAQSDAVPEDYIEGQGDEVVDKWREVWEAEAACLSVGMSILPVSSGRRPNRSRSFERHSRIPVGTKIWARFLSDEGPEPITDQQFAGVIRASDDGTAYDVYWSAAGETQDRLDHISVILSRRESEIFDGTGRPVQGLSLYVFWRAYNTAPGLGYFFWGLLRAFLIPHFNINDRRTAAERHSQRGTVREGADLRYVLHFIRAAQRQCLWLGW